MALVLPCRLRVVDLPVSVFFQPCSYCPCICIRDCYDLSLLPFYVTFADYYILSPTKKKPDKETQVKPNESPPKPDGLNTGPDENVKDVCERYV